MFIISGFPYALHNASKEFQFLLGYRMAYTVPKAFPYRILNHVGKTVEANL